MSLYKKIGLLYELFYQKAYSTQYKLHHSEKIEKEIKSFINLLDKKYSRECIGDNFLIDYFIFQFSYWFDLKIENFDNKVHLHFIIGKKAFKRWLDRNKDYDWSINLVQKHKIDIKRNNIIHLLSQINNEENDNDLLINEEIEKKRFLNINRGFLNCLEKTSLFNNKSLTCLSCKYKKDCKKILEDKFPQIYYSRFNFSNRLCNFQKTI